MKMILYNLFRWNGRTNRAGIWAGTMVILALGFFSDIVIDEVFRPQRVPISEWLGITRWFVAICTTYMFTALVRKRLQDCQIKPNLWLFVGFVILLIGFLCERISNKLESSIGKNEFLQNPVWMAVVAVGIACSVFMAFAGFYLYFVKGTDGENELRPSLMHK